jgi:hypothetical protein
MNSVLEHTALVICKILGTYGSASIAICGFVFVDRKLFARCLYLMMLTTIYNTILKDLFQLPLPATCPTEGFGLPSGHFHFMAILYLWIIVHFKNKYVRLLSLSVMAIYGYSIVIAGYHYAIDVWTALGFAILSITLRDKIHGHELMIAIFLCAILAGQGRITSGSWSALPQHVYMALFFIIGLHAGIYEFLKGNIECRNGMIQSLISCCLIGMTYILLNHCIDGAVQWGLFALSVPAAVRLSHAIVSTKQNSVGKIR